jgi:hypothetical protein
MRNVSSRAKLVVAALGCAAFLAVAVPAQARTEPVSLNFSGTFTAPTIISTQPLIGFTTDHLRGDGTPLGSFTAVYPHLVNFDTATFSGVAVFTTADGHRLVVQLGGSASPTSPTTYAVTYAGPILGGTGRFEGASGVLTGPGTVDLANLTVAATLTGTIKLH